MKTKILADFQICISVPLKLKQSDELSNSSSKRKICPNSNPKNSFLGSCVTITIWLTEARKHSIYSSTNNWFLHGQI